MKHSAFLRYCVSFFLICILLVSVLPRIVFAHPGSTDSSGGHTDHSTGEYHYHHGYPAHEHYDMDGDGDVDCPYDFVDSTKHSSTKDESYVQSSTAGKMSNDDHLVSSESKLNIAAGGDVSQIEQWWKQPIDEEKLMINFFIFGIPSAILAIVLFFILSKYDTRIPKSIRVLLSIVMVLSGIIALPAVFYLFSLSYVLVAVVTLIVFLIKWLIDKFHKPVETIVHTKVIILAENCTDKPFSLEAVNDATVHGASSELVSQESPAVPPAKSEPKKESAIRKSTNDEFMYILAFSLVFALFIVMIIIAFTSSTT